MGSSAALRACACFAAVLAGCGGSSATLLVEVVDTKAGASFDSLDVHVYDPHGVVASTHVAKVILPGALVAKHLADKAQVVRVVVAGNGAMPALGAAETMMVAGGQATAQVDLASSLQDSDGDGVPDAYDDCPNVPDPDQHSTNGGAPGDACGGGGDMAVGLDLASGGMAGGGGGGVAGGGGGGTTAILDMSMAPPADMAGVLLFDDFTSDTLDPNLWVTNVGGGGKVTVAGGLVTINAGTAASAFAELVSKTSFPVGTTFTARVSLAVGQTYDEKGVGYANARLSDGCGTGETEAAMIRGQSNILLIEPKTNNISQCGALNAEQNPYPAGYRTFKIVRLSSNEIDFYDGTAAQTDTFAVPGGLLPARIGTFTSTANPADLTDPVTIIVDWVLVTQN